MYSSTVSDGSGALFHCSELTPRAPYRREFDEMEARIRKCERQRAELERQFEELMRERTECEKATVRAMKQRQRRQQEAERQRAERNESILRMLNKIDQQAASLAAKTDRLKMLKTQYEMYLMRTWSTSSGLALPAAYGVPMITAPPAMLTPLPQSPAKSSTKSEFVQYLSDLTHLQTANVNSIPPPMALSNYLASQQKPYGMASTYAASLERPYSRAYTSSAPIENDCLMVNSGAGTSQSTTVGGIQPKKFTMSNEDFIRYIDSEVLKEPIPTVSIVAPSPFESDQVKQSGGAYLEDATMSEDEPVREVANKLEEFSILVDPDIRKDITEEHHKEDIKVVTEMIERDHQNMKTPETIQLEKRSMELPTLVESVKDDNETNVDIDFNAGNKTLDDKPDDRTHNDIQEILQDSTAPPDNDAVVNETANEDYHQTINQEEYNDTNFEAEVVPANTNVDYDETTPATDQHLYTTEQTEPVPYDNLQYGASNEPILNPEETPEMDAQQLPQPVQQYESRNQHWNTARQALRSKALPVSTSKPPSPETGVSDHVAPDLQQGMATTESHAETWRMDQADVQAPYENAQPNTVTQIDESNATYSEYGGEPSDAYYQTEPAATAAVQDGGEQNPSSTDQAYINGAMGQPVEYQHDDGQQSAAYQYGNSQDPVAYQEGQYVEGGTAGESQYQYQEGVDQTGNVYATQEQYQDPNQQYQYDQNAQYYSDQQAYDAQYYNQDPQQQEQQQQQQQQQYYINESNQQQMDQNQAEQLKPMEQFVSPEQNDQPYYPSDGQYEPNAKNAEPTQPNPPEGGDVTVPSSLEPPLANAQTVETSAVIDATLPKDKQEKKASDAIVQQATLEQKPSRKEGVDPGSDAPTLSTVNDESDFDFSSQ
ncbi:putative mediator of RNA polymerase II transcription subunit 26 [Anopheles merus]|uniref:putative mediator of RNA polymerase II transcription subunit 26 n=1 Tax=Anopheles merus TaxID=30066 RepID=UPI001BE3F359|nr:putative mediator of RNA polymerase II transcription subunit 26 [Anopheles merus]XP_041785853.1 putative mediator of RNA polymerase II transcription subunit 26 [Anopheles merus]